MPDHAHPRFAKMYMKAAARADASGGDEHRRRLLRGLSGRVIEVGAGHGVNFQHYPPAVTEVVAVEPEPTLRAAALKASATAPVRITIRDGDADALPASDGELDAAVASLVLCSVPDQATALAEIRRVLRPGGELRFYEHVVADRQPGRALLQLIDRTGVWPRLAGGCHPARDTTGALQAAGFAIESIDRFGFSPSRLEPPIPHVLGVARRPGD